MQSLQKNKSYVAYTISALCVAYSLIHLWITFNPIPELLQRSFHTCVGLGLVFLLFPVRCCFRGLEWILFAICCVCFLYLFFEYQDIVTTRGGIPNLADIVLAIITTLLVLEATRRVTGVILPILALIFLSYPFFSHLDFMPHKMLTRPYGLDDIFGQLYLKTEGIFSTAIGASATFIFLFILFGAFLSRSGMGKLFNDLAMALAGKTSGGPAKVAVISSGFMGSINGSAIANVVGTGAFTIPLMKKIGYDKNFAGAIEASASVGGQVLPPIMGASAFIMAETTGVSYATIALAALLPAILYFFAVMLQVHFYAKKNNLKGISADSLPLLKDVLKARGHMLLPMLLLIILLSQSVPISFVAVYTIFFSVIISWLKKETRMGIIEILGALEDGAKQSLAVMVSCAAVGIIIGVASLTSLGNVITSSIVILGAGSLLFSLILTMLASMVLGMGLPSIPAYIITATMAAPALASFDIPIIVSHLFVFYFGIFANITPPVALASFAAAGISQGDPMKTSFYAIRLSLVGFMIPFAFIYNPAIILFNTQAGGIMANTFSLLPIDTILATICATLVSVIALAMAVEGHFVYAMNIICRVLMGVGGILLLLTHSYGEIAGISLILIAGFIHFLFTKRYKDS